VKAGRPISKRNRARFLELLAEGETVTAAALATGHGRQRYYELRRVDLEFAAAWDQAIEAGTDALEAEAVRRATEGYDEVTYGADGRVIRSVHRKSDQLLALLLKGRRYHEQRVELSGPGGQPLAVEHRLQMTLREGLEAIAARHRREALESVPPPPPPELALPRPADEIESWSMLELEPEEAEGDG
jgi:hypothetical protein